MADLTACKFCGLEFSLAESADWPEFEDGRVACDECQVDQEMIKPPAPSPAPKPRDWNDAADWIKNLIHSVAELAQIIQRQGADAAKPDDEEDYAEQKRRAARNLELLNEIFARNELVRTVLKPTVDELVAQLPEDGF